MSSEKWSTNKQVLLLLSDTLVIESFSLGCMSLPKILVFTKPWKLSKKLLPRALALLLLWYFSAALAGNSSPQHDFLDALCKESLEICFA
jgi:hypothetical protein